MSGPASCSLICIDQSLLQVLYKLAVSKMAARVNVRSCWVADIVETEAWLIKYSDVSFCGEGASIRLFRFSKEKATIKMADAFTQCGMLL